MTEVVAVVTQPDRPAGRGLGPRPPEVKRRAGELGLPTWQPAGVRTAEFAEQLRALEPHVGVVVAYGRILPSAVLRAPAHGCVNVHASLLPRWRGAAPVQHAILHGDRETGVCLMQMDEGMDTGPIVGCDRVAIDPDESAEMLSRKLSELGAKVLARDLKPYLAGDRAPVPQDETSATRAPPLRKGDGRLDWTKTARAVHDHVRAVTPWPGASTGMEGKRVKVHRTRVVERGGRAAAPGTLVRADSGGILVACGEGVLGVEELQLEGKRRMEARELLKGIGWTPGMCFEG